MNEVSKRETTTLAESKYKKEWKVAIENFFASIDVSPTTKESYRKGIYYFAKWLEEKGYVTPNQKNVIEYKEELLKDHEIATCNLYIVSIKRFYKFLKKHGLVSDDITEEVHTEKISEEDRRDCLTRNQIQKLVEYVKGNDRELLLTLLQCKCAMRTVEISRLNCGSVGTKNGNYVLWVQGKGRKKADECIPISEGTYNLINRYLGTINNKPNEPMFTSLGRNSFGKRLGTRGIRKIMSKNFRSVGINSKRVNSHSLRTTCLNILVEEGADIMTVMQYARHSNPETTIKKYINSNNKLKEKVKGMNIIEEIIQV